MSKSATKTKSSKTTEMTAAIEALVNKRVEVTGGKKWPGRRATVLSVGKSRRFESVYAMLRIDGETENAFADPKHLKVIGAEKPAKIAALQAEVEAAREATLLVSGKVREERETSVLLDHYQWYRPVWFPKSLLTLMTTDPMENGEHLYEVPRWKVLSALKAKGTEALEARQEEWQAIVDADPMEQPVTEVIKAGTQAAKAAKAGENTKPAIAAIKAKLAAKRK